MLNVLIHDHQIEVTLKQGTRVNNLEKAIMEVPLPLLAQLPLDQQFCHLDILSERFESPATAYTFQNDPSPHRFSDLSEGLGLLPLMFLFKAAIEVQIGNLSEHFPCIEPHAPDPSGRWRERREENDFALRLENLRRIFAISKNCWRHALDPDYDWLAFDVFEPNQFDKIANEESFESLPDGHFPRPGGFLVPRQVTPEPGGLLMPRRAIVKEQLENVLIAVPLEDIPVEDQECSICKEPFITTGIDDTTCQVEVVKLPCGHFLGKECLLARLEQSQRTTCPVCRRPVLDEPQTPSDFDPNNIWS